MTTRVEELEKLLRAWLELDPTKPGAARVHGALIDRTEEALRDRVEVLVLPDPFPALPVGAP